MPVKLVNIDGVLFENNGGRFVECGVLGVRLVRTSAASAGAETV